MPPSAVSVIEHYASIDDLLGDGRHRFFSQGYKSTNPRLRDLRVVHDSTESTLTARAGLSMHGLWSVKGGAEQTPHLGTTDVMVLACRMGEALLASRYSPDLLPAAHVTSVTISGGSEPVEGALRDLECRAVLQSAPGGGGSVLRCSVASMTAVAHVAHGTAEPGLASVQAPSEEALVGDSGDRLYGARWAERDVSLTQVRMDPERGTARAGLAFRQGASPSPHGERRGLEAAYPDALCAVEYFVATLQLGQVLLYRLDAMDRADSNTLWMRKTRVALDGPGSVVAGGPGTDLSVHLRNKRLVEKDGESWRCADVVGTFDGGEVVCKVAHRLPARQASEAVR